MIPIQGLHSHVLLISSFNPIHRSPLAPASEDASGGSIDTCSTTAAPPISPTLCNALVSSPGLSNLAVPLRNVSAPPDNTIPPSAPTARSASVATNDDVPSLPSNRSIHTSAPPCSIIMEHFPVPFSLEHKDSNPGPIDPFDLLRWRPNSDISVPPRPR